jgi:PilZ domain
MSEQSGNEQRSYSRVDFDKPVSISVNEQSCIGQLLDISLKGAMLQLESIEDIRIDSVCLLRMTLSEQEVIEMHATVVWTGNNQLGLLCDSIDLDSITNLKRLLELNMADPALLDRELASLIQ